MALSQFAHIMDISLLHLLAFCILKDDILNLFAIYLSGILLSFLSWRVNVCLHMFDEGNEIFLLQKQLPSGVTWVSLACYNHIIFILAFLWLPVKSVT